MLNWTINSKYFKGNLSLSLSLSFFYPLRMLLSLPRLAASSGEGGDTVIVLWWPLPLPPHHSTVIIYTVCWSSSWASYQMCYGVIRMFLIKELLLSSGTPCLSSNSKLRTHMFCEPLAQTDNHHFGYTSHTWSMVSWFPIQSCRSNSRSN